MTARLGWIVAAAVVLATTGVWGCEEHAQAADAKDAKPAAATAQVKGCDMPCCAKKTSSAVAAADPKAAPSPAVPAVNGDAKQQAPCSAKDGAACPKKSAAAKTKAGTDAPKPEPVAGAGAGR